MPIRRYAGTPVAEKRAEGGGGRCIGVLPVKGGNIGVCRKAGTPIGRYADTEGGSIGVYRCAGTLI